MKPHDLDVVSLVAGLVFAVLGAVGLLQAAGVVDDGSAWAVIGVIAAVGGVGVAASAHRLASDAPAHEDPESPDSPNLAESGENPS